MYDEWDSHKKRVAATKNAILKPNEKKRLIKTALSCLDLTLLDPNATDEQLKELCSNAIGEWGHVAGVCVMPTQVEFVRKFIKANSGVKVVSVAGGFPNGDGDTITRVEEAKMAVALGADEIDIVIDFDAVNAGNREMALDSMLALREATKEVSLKVILETSEYETPQLLNIAGISALNAGADFLKTSTGRRGVATPQVAIALADLLSLWNEGTDKKNVALKISGGVRTTEDAVQMMRIVERVWGEGTLTPETFRFGASALLTDLLSSINS